MRLARRQIRRAPGRVLAIVLAGLLSAMAIMGTGTFIQTMQRALTDSLAAPVSRGDIVVRTGDASVQDAAQQVAGVAAVEPLGQLQVTAASSERRVEAMLWRIPADEQLRWMQLREGTWPVAANEVALPADELRQLGVQLGDSITVSSFGGFTQQVVVVGVVDAPNSTVGGAPSVFASPTLFEQNDLFTSGLLVRTAPSANVEQVATDLRTALGGNGASVLTVSAFVAQQVDQITGGTNALLVMLLLFVSIGVLAAVMVIRNTFEVLLAQRLRENGLLRLVGATGGQVQRSVLAEALLVSIIGALAGIALGFGLGVGIAAVLHMLVALPTFSFGWALAASAVTVGATLLAAWVPALRLRRLSPVAALGEANLTAAERGHGRRAVAWVFGLGVSILGAAIITFASLTANPLILVGGGIVLALGLIVLVPLLVRSIMPPVARMLASAGPVTKLAGENLVRTSRRSGTVVLAIALGGSLILAMLTGTASMRATFNQKLDDKYPFDAFITADTAATLDRATLQPLLASPGLDDSAFTPAVPIDSDSGNSWLRELTVLPPQSQDALSGLETPLRDGQVAVAEMTPAMLGAAPGDAVTLTSTSGTSVDLELVVTEKLDSVTNIAGSGTLGIVTPTTLAEFGTPVADANLWAYARDGGVEPLVRALDQLENTNGNLTISGPIREQQLYNQVFDTMVTFVLAMLTLTVVISVIGLASVVALAVAERRRELALLRALGMTRSKTRRLVLIESITLALIGAAFSLVIGIPMGISAARPLTGGQREIVYALPWFGIAAVIVAAILLGMLAGARPAWKAARIAPATALAHT